MRGNRGTTYRIRCTGANQVSVAQSGLDVVVSLNLDSNILTAEARIVLTGTLILNMTASDFLL